jgi:hypothetical protein
MQLNSTIATKMFSFREHFSNSFVGTIFTYSTNVHYLMFSPSPHIPVTKPL